MRFRGYAGDLWGHPNDAKVQRRANELAGEVETGVKTLDLEVRAGGPASPRAHGPQEVPLQVESKSTTSPSAFACEPQAVCAGSGHEPGVGSDGRLVCEACGVELCAECDGSGAQITPRDYAFVCPRCDGSGEAL